MSAFGWVVARPCCVLFTESEWAHEDGYESPAEDIIRRSARAESKEGTIIFDAPDECCRRDAGDGNREGGASEEAEKVFLSKIESIHDFLFFDLSNEVPFGNNEVEGLTMA